MNTWYNIICHISADKKHARGKDDNDLTDEIPQSPKKKAKKEDKKIEQNTQEQNTQEPKDISDDDSESSDSDSDSDYDMDAELQTTDKKKKKDFEEVPQETASKFFLLWDCVLCY